MMQSPEFAIYFPDSLPKGRTMDRTYFFNVMSTLNQEYTTALVHHAEQHRHGAATQKNAEHSITVSDSWWNALMQQPYISCK